MKTLQEWCYENNRMDILERWSKENDMFPNEIGFGFEKKVKWVCSNNHIWEASPNKITQKQTSGCPYCSSQKVWIGFNDLYSNFPEVAEQWNYDKNLELKPTEVTSHSNKKVWWVCNKGHEFQMAVCDRTAKKRKNCPYCVNKHVLKGFNDLNSICPEVAKEWHPIKNGKMTPDQVLSSSSKKYWWMCDRGHEYQACLNNRVNKGKRKSGCPFCAGKRVLQGFNDIATVRPEIVNEWDVERNGGKLASEILAGTHFKYWWVCPVGHEYQASPENRTKNATTNCPICARQSQTSFPEQAIFYYLKRIFPDAKNRYLYEGQEIDIFIPSIKVGIEYDGKLFHTKDTQNREENKEKKLMNYGIRLIRVKEYCGNKGEEKRNLIWINERKKQDNNIKYALEKILDLLGLDNYSLNLDISEDRINIMDQYYVSMRKKSFAFYHPELIKEWDGDRNHKLKIEMFSTRSGIKVWWKCDKGHSYNMSFDSRSKGTGCPICAGQRLLEGFNDLKTRYPEIAKEWCQEKNNGLTPEQVMPGNHTKVWWRCKSGHIYIAAISSRTNRKSGCPYCSGRRVVSGINDLCTKFPWVVEKWDFEKNKGIDIKQQSPYTHAKVWWKCKEGHSFYSEISEVTAHYEKKKLFRCPICSGSIKKKVINLDTNEIFESLESAARSCGLKKGDTISLCCRSKQEKAGGYRWKYLN